MAHRTEIPHAGLRWRALLSRWRPALNLALATGLLAGSAGCTRRYYREQTDKDVSEILANKDKYEDWKIENWWVYPHPLSRFADSSNPDRPPMPPDDPAAYTLSPNPQHPPHAGIKCTEGTGYLDLIAQWDHENREQRERQEAQEKASVEPPLPPAPAGGLEEQEAEAQPPAPPPPEQACAAPRARRQGKLPGDDSAHAARRHRRGAGALVAGHLGPAGLPADARPGGRIGHVQQPRVSRTSARTSTSPPCR